MLVYVKGKGIVLREPSVVAVNRNTGEIIAIGEEARVMLGRTLGNIVAVRPLRNGVISNFHILNACCVLFSCARSSEGVCSSSRGSSYVFLRVSPKSNAALSLKLLEEAGARHTGLIEEPMAAAIGAGIDTAAPFGNMVIDVGGGTTDVAVISLGGIVMSDSVKIAGDKFDEAIIRYSEKET